MEREQQLQKIELGLIKAKDCLETIGTESAKPAWNPDNFSNLPLVKKLRQIGLGKKGLTEKTIPVLQRKRNELIWQIEEEQKRTETLRNIAGIEKELPELQRLVSEGWLTQKQLAKAEEQLASLKESVGLGIKPEEKEELKKEKPKEEIEKSEREPVRITFIDGTSFEEQRAIIAARILKHLAENLDGYTPEEIEELKRTLEYKPVTNGELAKGVFGEENPSNKMRLWNNMNTVIKLAVKQGWNLEKSTQEKQIEFCLKKIKEQPEEIKELKEYQMTEEEAAMFGSMVKAHNNVQLFGQTQNIDRDQPLFTLEFDTETIKLCDELINQYNFNETTEEQIIHIELLRAQAVDKLKKICEGGSLGKEILNQQSEPVQSLYTNLLCIYEEILGNDLCCFLIEKLNKKKIIEKATEEKSKSPYLLEDFVKYWVVPSASFPERIKIYLESKKEKLGQEEIKVQEELEKSKSKAKERKIKTEIERVVITYPLIREKIGCILDRWEEQFGKDPEKRSGGNEISTLFQGCGVPKVTPKDEDIYLKKKYAEFGFSKDNHKDYNQFETVLYLCWKYCNKGKDWRKKTVVAVKQMIKEEIEKREPEKR